jgi:NAD(P)-dependent dehydrogenase (short-subunit alcohol dehydrogenase family)
MNCPYRCVTQGTTTMQLNGKVGLVTGAAHRVGKAIALALAREGVSIAVHYGGSEQAARDTVAEIKTLGVDAFSVQADLRDPAQIDRLFETVAERFGRLDVLVNSAASFTKQPFDEISVDDWKDAFQTNLRAPFLCTQRAARLMRSVTDRPADQPAAIVNIADLSGIYPWHGYTQHGVSKAGIIHLTKVSAYELGPEIRVNAIAPGAILPPPGLSLDRWADFGDRLPLKRTGSPDYVGQAVVFLAQNDYITGALIPVDGGEHLVGTLK